MQSPDHPHTRGENVQSGKEVASMTGPSPHAWGKPPMPDIRTTPSFSGPSPHAWGKRSSACARRSIVRVASRTIPTRVGKTNKASKQYLMCRTIPTRVGKTLVAGRYAYVLHGPSPHAWGKLRWKTSSHWTGAPSPDGPSPHAWGKQQTRRYASRGPARTIPTRVGKTPHDSQIAPSIADHPHTRGENATFTMPNRHPGPSPHAWGKLRPSSG